jgi:monoamine oxidase
MIYFHILTALIVKCMKPVQTASSTTEKPYSVVIIGACIAMAYWLQKKYPHKRFTILEARETLGGAQSLFRYPGSRSGSDMFTFGYRFKPCQNLQPLSEGNNAKFFTAVERLMPENYCKVLMALAKQSGYGSADYY